MAVQVVEPIGRRQRKKSQTRDALRSAAVRLVGERGLDGVTIEDITEAADVSPRTFFNYFPSKEAVLTAPDADWLARIRADLASRPRSEPPLRALQEVLVADMADLERRRDEWLRQVAVLKSDPRLLAALAAGWGQLERELAGALARRSGARANPLRAAVLAAAGVAALRTAIDRWNGDVTESLAGLIRASFEALINGGAAAARLRATGVRS